MADGTAQNGADLIATDELVTLNGAAATGGVKAQRAKVGFGVDGDFTDASATNPLPVTMPALKTEDSPAVSGDLGLPMLCMRQLADTTSTDNDGDYTLVKIDEEGRVKVATKPASFALESTAITVNGGTAFSDVRRASNIQIHMVATSLVGHNATFEGSIDSTNGTDGNWFGIQVVRSNANTIETVTGVLAATPGYAWEASVNGLSYVRVRATAHTSGSALWKFQRGSYATEPIPAAQVSGTQTVTGTFSISNNAASPNTFLVADVASAAITTSTTTAAITPTFGQSYEVHLGVTAVSGTTPTLDFTVQESLDNGTNWFDVYTFPRITATGSYVSPILNMRGTRLRYVQTVAGTTPSFTRVVNRVQRNEGFARQIAQIFDRTIVPNTLNSTTTSLDIKASNNAELVVNMGAITTTAPQFTIEASADNGATWYALSTALTAVASTTVKITVNNIFADLIRARVSTAGVGATLNYALLRGF